jgi:hypothetical protein
MIKIKLLISTIITIASLTALCASAETFQKDDQFAITLPDEWVEIPKDILHAYTENIAKLAPNVPKQAYDYGYQFTGVENWFT